MGNSGIGFFVLFALIFISLILNNLIYLKKLKKLLKYLNDRHSEKIRDWGLPDSLMDISPRRMPKLLAFIKSPDYFNDPELQIIKKKVSKHLKISIWIWVIGIPLIIIYQVLIGVLMAMK